MSPATGFARALLQTHVNNTACADALALADADALARNSSATEAMEAVLANETGPCQVVSPEGPGTRLWRRRGDAEAASSDCSASPRPLAAGDRLEAGASLLQEEDMKGRIPGETNLNAFSMLNVAMCVFVLICMQAGSNRHLSRLELGLAVGVPLLFLLALLLATLVGLLYLKPRLARYREQKKQRAAADKCSESPSLKSGNAPGLGPDTALVLTDVQNSTTLFEILPTEVMDRAMRLHDECFRRNLTKHRGYESATEGDAFIMSFFHALDALRFCMDVQQDLLTLDWPQEVLSSPDARAVYVRPAEPSVAAQCETPMRGPSHHQPAFMVNSRRRGLEVKKGALPPGKGPRPIGEGDEGQVDLAGTDLEMSMTASEASGARPHPHSPRSHKKWPAGLQGMLSRVSVTFKDDTSPGVSGRRPSFSLLRPSSINVPRPSSGQLLVSEASAGADLDSPCSSDEASAEDASLGSGTYRELLGKKWLKSGRGGQRSSVQCVTIFRGLKVRMGMHCGITEERDIAFDGLTNRAFYSGLPMDLTRAICDCTPGGFAMLSSKAFSRATQLLQVVGSARASIVIPEALEGAPLAVYVGEHRLEKLGPDFGALSLFVVVPTALQARLAYMAPLRYHQECSLGSLAAPVGIVTVVYLKVLHRDQLLADLPKEAREALALFQQVAGELLYEHGGYAKEMNEGLVLAAFSSPANALCWALAVVDAMPLQDWPPAILDHPLCRESELAGQEAQPLCDVELQGVLEEEKLSSSYCGGGGGGLSGISHAHLRAIGTGLSSQKSCRSSDCESITGQTTYQPIVCPQPPSGRARGLRVKAGIDMGIAAAELVMLTGRIHYRGKVMNRASRITSTATAGSVFCSAAVWSAAADHPSCLRDGVYADCLGEHQMKGVASPMTLWSCRRGSRPPSPHHGTCFAGVGASFFGPNPLHQQEQHQQEGPHSFCSASPPTVFQEMTMAELSRASASVGTLPLEHALPRKQRTFRRASLDKLPTVTEAPAWLNKASSSVGEEKPQRRSACVEDLSCPNQDTGGDVRCRVYSQPNALPKPTPLPPRISAQPPPDDIGSLELRLLWPGSWRNSADANLAPSASETALSRLAAPAFLERPPSVPNLQQQQHHLPSLATRLSGPAVGPSTPSSCAPGPALIAATASAQGFGLQHTPSSGATFYSSSLYSPVALLPQQQPQQPQVSPTLALVDIMAASNSGYNSSVRSPAAVQHAAAVSRNSWLRPLALQPNAIPPVLLAASEHIRALSPSCAGSPCGGGGPSHASSGASASAGMEKAQVLFHECASSQASSDPISDSSSGLDASQSSASKPGRVSGTVHNQQSHIQSEEKRVWRPCDI